MKSSVLCYNLKNTKKGKQIAMLFGFLGYKIRHVEKAEYMIPIGVLSCILKDELQRPDFIGDAFEEEMLVINAATEKLMDQALFLMRKDGIKVELKAMITPSNLEWTSIALYDEIKKEHETMKEIERDREN